ncbi:ATPase subunit of ABC transporter with duplicated ATPase domains [Saccharothrix tamanrassetensis]|uniref:ATPase subunit of ABC transporter with duplicated ATPase domains n=1 Tax=Saccharothrix tamanrassetensis TaxID=1051531 RepID=A0A841CHQ5_9PSEU|nr:ABC-F family ATP-binding cassette domain-containing protein [Saccharothrix tamanrassetensis]MBB5956513.1 ATPase subunit of ABC transporter with duplicated ATPase domains [Saccharothrix tamanrassetensis]
MPALTARNVSLSFGPRTVLQEVDLDVHAGQRIGLSAPNGVGKSSLLRVLAGEIEPDEGTVTASGTVAHLTQETTIEPGESLRAHLAGRTGVARAVRRFEEAAEALATGRPGADDAYVRAFDHWTAVGAADFDERADEVCERLGLPANLLDRRRPLSGGQSARLRLASVLLVRADVLLLDEPTNDLDAAGLDLLESHVPASRAAVVLVSHDREFLARTTTAVAELDEFTHRLTLFGGGWDAYVAEQARARSRAREEYEAYAAKRDSLAQRAQQTREWSKAGVRRNAKSDESDKNIKFARKQGAENTAAKASTVDRALDRLDEVEEPREPWELRLTLPTAGRGSQVAFTLRDAVVSRGDVTLGPIDLTIGAGERWRITGPNGAGKSTLLAALLGRLPLREGDRSQGASVVVGEVDQVRASFATDTPALTVVAEATGLSDVEVRTLLAKFRVGADAVLRPAASLSPGERTRAGLAVLQARGTTCLVLDEPTNHLDVAAIEQLERALETYEGTLLLVTHDRRLADAVGVDHTLDVRTLAR